MHYLDSPLLLLWHSGHLWLRFKPPTREAENISCVGEEVGCIKLALKWNSVEVKDSPINYAAVKQTNKHKKEPPAKERKKKASGS